MGYTKDAIKGVSWVGAIRVSTRFFSFVKTLIVARVLTPGQFGVFGIALLVLTLIDILTETGVDIFLVQHKGNIQEYINTAWIISILRGILIWIAIIITAPLIGNFFRTPNAFSILLLISVVPLINGFVNPSVAKFQKELLFHKQFIYRSSVLFIESFFSIIFVLIVRSIEGLVLGLIASAIFEAVASFLYVKPKPKFEFDKEKFLSIFHFGKWVTVSSIFNYFYQHGDDIIVGKLLGSGALGLYDMAYRLSLIPITDIADTISQVAFPVYAKISDDKKRLQAAFLKSLAAVIICVAPIGIILFVFPHFIVSILLGNHWLSIIPVLRVLAFFGVIRAISVFSSTIFLSIKKQKIASVISLIGFFGLFITIIPFVQRFGIVGAAYSALIGTSITIPVIAYFLYSYLYQ